MATQWAVPICKPRLLKEPKAQASYYADRYEQTYGLGPPRVSFEGSVVTQTQPQKDTKTQAKAASTNSQLSRPDNNANLPGPDNSKLHQEIAKLETQVSMLKAELAWLSGQWERLKVIKTLAPVCQICFTLRANCVFLPCFHASSCLTCANKLTQQQCPFCATRFTCYKQLYFS